MGFSSTDKNCCAFFNFTRHSAQQCKIEKKNIENKTLHVNIIIDLLLLPTVVHNPLNTMQVVEVKNTKYKL